MGACAEKLKNLKEDILNTETEIEAVRFDVQEHVAGQDAHAAATFKRLGLSSGTVNQLYGAFRAIDIDDGGQIAAQEFYTFFRLEQSKFTDRAFLSFDKDGSGEIDFEEL